MSEQDPPTGQPPQHPYGQPAWGQQPSPGYSPPGYGQPALPKHPQAQTAMVLGIIALAGSCACILPIFLSPFAWYLGAKAKREIAAEPGRWGGRSDAQAGFILGIIGTVLIVVGIALLCLVALILLLAISSEPSSY